MRWLGLYLRSRSAPATLAVVVGGTGALWALRPAVDDPPARAVLALLAAVAATAAIAPGLVGADPDLDRSAGIAWPPRRALHVVVAGAAVAGVLVTYAVTGDPPDATGLVIRDVTGLSGLVALGTTVLGATRAWLPAMVWTLSVMPVTVPFGTPPTGPGYTVALTWMIQPAGTAGAAVTGASLGVAGTVAYAIFGPRR